MPRPAFGPLLLRRVAPCLIAFACFDAPLFAQRGSEALHRTTRLESAGGAPEKRVVFGPGSTLPPTLRRRRRPAIVLTGYWPPSNEALRRFSDEPAKNALGWIGSDWEGRGYDVFAYFPEFNPPNCVSCGVGTGHLRVDYQATSADFRPLVEQHTPLAVLTFSRGFNTNDWEVEMNQYNRSSWVDDFIAPLQPTPSPPDASLPPDALRPSTLPAQAIVDAVFNQVLGVRPFICFSGNGGAFLSEFMAYLGVWYQDDHASPADPKWCAAAGHIHVGAQLDSTTAEECVMATLRAVIDHLDATIDDVLCQPELIAGGPGTARIAVCGGDLSTGTSADLSLFGAPPNTLAIAIVGDTLAPFAWQGGILQPSRFVTHAFGTDARGLGMLRGIPGGLGPFSAYTQVVYKDASQGSGWGFSNTLRVELRP